MPIIHVELIAGRTRDQKRALIRALTDATVAALDAPEQSIRVILSEVAAEHWGIGGVSKSDRDGGEKT